jgi:hypothetical protein
VLLSRVWLLVVPACSFASRAAVVASSCRLAPSNAAAVWERLTPRCIDEDRRRERGQLAQEALRWIPIPGNLGPKWTYGS